MFLIKPILTFLVYSLLFFSPLSLSKNTHAREASLPLPGSLPLVDYERQLYRWILDREYTKLGWAKDKDVRDTGPFIDQTYYGTHPAVRIYYSPAVMSWLESGRSKGESIPDGAMIIKEMYTPPAAIYQQFAADPKYQDPKKYEKLLARLVNNWTIMVKDNRASNDGWFWGSVGLPTKGQSIKEAINSQVDTLANRGNSELRWSGFAMPCLRCHASAKNELTFSDLANIEGYPGQPLLFKSDDSWRTPEYIAESYPLCTLKNDTYVQRFMYLPPNNQPADDINCPPSINPANSVSVFSDHDQSNNVVYELPSIALSDANNEFLSTFTKIPRQIKSQVKHFPPEWLDSSVMPADHPTEFVTSDNCIGCHGGLSGTPNRPVMFVENGDSAADGFDVSAYGEWRWSPMGLAGRDPIFHAQIESEMAYLARDAQLDKNLDKEHLNQKPLLKAPLAATQNAVTNVCLSCHGAMGERQLSKDADADPSLDPNFKLDYFYLYERLTTKEQKKSEKNGTAAYDKYGALAREGISCMVCHQIDAPDEQEVAQWDPNTHHNKWITPKTNKELAYNLFFHSTGNYNPGPVGEVFGPFDVLEKPMGNSLNVKPLKNHYTSDSQMCGNCHTINLPNIGQTVDEFPVLTATAKGTDFEKYPHSIEQATFLEWQNSAFAAVDKKGNPKEDFKSCQDCHMPGSFENAQAGINIDNLLTQIASIQDTSYPAAAHTLPNEEIAVPMRDDYSRHTHVGLNVFLLSMVDQFNDVLGLQKSSYMTGSSNGIAIALDSMTQQAQKATADIDISDVTLEALDNGENVLKADVTITNKSGHRYPSGVAFRRAFVEFTVTSNGKTLWQSGGTNGIGVIVDGNGQPLDTEFLPTKNKYQPHYEIIDSEKQVQIYEELNLNAQEEFTTSFVHRVTLVKDNRLLPKGWRESRFFKKQGEVMEQFMAATDPHGKALNDKDYNSEDNLNFPGRDKLTYKAKIPAGIDPESIRVTATLYNQSIPPYWLKQRFEAAPEGEGTKRLHYMASHLNLEGSPMENWKLRLVSDTARVVKNKR